MAQSTRGTWWRRRMQRGVSLLEGLIASMVLLIGLVGVLQGLYTSAQQNGVANRMTRAGAIARQVIAGLQAQGRGRLEGTGGLFQGSNCGAASGFSTLIDGLDTIPSGDFDTICVADIDNYDGVVQVAAPAAQIVPWVSYPADDRTKFRRLAVYIRNSADPDRRSYVGVVVTWTDLGRRFYHRQFMSFYDPAINQTGVQL